MTKDDFISGYIKRSEVTREFFNENYIAIPCDCDYENCNGWAAVEPLHPSRKTLTGNILNNENN